MKIKKGDKVVVMTGKDSGKTGVVQKAMPKEGMIIVEGVNMKKRHAKPIQGGQGQIIEFAAPIQVSNVMIVDPKDNKPSRVGKKKVGDKFVRVAVNSQQEL
jgi:large subunit ribosomal protein L24